MDRGTSAWIAAARRLLFGAVLIAIPVLGAPELSGQRADQLRQGMRAPVAADPPRAIIALRPPAPTYWKEGAIIGTLVGALVIWKAGVVGIEKFTPRVGFGLLLAGGLVGGVPGALIGGQFPKRP
jgi:hypothetical protein